MPDWTQSMKRTYEFFEVDPTTWHDKRKIDTITKATISRDSGVETKGSCSIDTTEDLGECYVRIYLVTSQNGETERFPLGTYLVQTPSDSFNGKYFSYSMDGYTTLMELKENPPPLGYSLLKKENLRIMKLCSVRIPLVSRLRTVDPGDETKLERNFISNTDDTWLSFFSSLAAMAKYDIDVDELGTVIFKPYQEIAAMTPIWTYTDDENSIIQPNITTDKDMFGIPNAVEVVCNTGTAIYTAKVVNDNSDSEISTVNRGREILHRVTNVDLPGIPTKAMVTQYAKDLLVQLSTMEYTINYTHAYCPVRVGDCVMINYRRAGLNNVKAKVISQSITCDPSCQVSETAVFSLKLWEPKEG